MAPPPAALEPGAVVKQYRLVRELGRGAMGRVFLAWDRGLRRRVAIKFFDESAYDVGERFLVEARATARCRHENIVAIYEVGEHRGRPFLVLEYLEGALLTTLLGRGPMQPARALDLILPVVRALVCAHAAGIVHRDLKPDNILVTDEGTIKVLDFGIAKMVTDATAPIRRTCLPPPRTAPGASRLTAHGTVLGTMPYMAPEQWGQDRSLIDDRTDIWAIGILLFEMVCGRHPLAPLSYRRLRVIRNLDEPMPTVADVAPEVPAAPAGALAGIIDDCLRKPRAERLGSARALLARLEAARPGSRGPGGAARRAAGPGDTGAPYPGPAPFGEGDAHRFFGRFWDAARTTARIRSKPLVCVTGPAGAGKTSLVQAGVIPGLRASGEPWEVLALRAGTRPLAALARLLAPRIEPCARSRMADADARARLLLDTLHAEPDALPALLHRCAQQRAGKVLLFVDQLELLCAPQTDARERAAFIACLSGLAERAGTRVRAVMTMRQQALAHAACEHVFFRRLGRAMEHLAPLDRAGLAQALVQPAAMCGYRFESRGMIEALLDVLAGGPNPLPRLQDLAARLWAARDRERRLLTRQSLDVICAARGDHA